MESVGGELALFVDAAFAAPASTPLDTGGGAAGVEDAVGVLSSPRLERTGLSSETVGLVGVVGGVVFSFARRTSAPSDAGFFGSRAVSSIRFHASV
jgi:hypothetical protein